jgi:hypothetical protein
LLKNQKEGLDSFLRLIFDNRYLNLIQNNFKYILPYAFVVAMISKNRSYINSIKSKNCDNDFAKLFKSVYFTLNIDDYSNYIEKCCELMKSDYFLNDYIELFRNKTKETLLENYIKLNNIIELK